MENTKNQVANNNNSGMRVTEMQERFVTVKHSFRNLPFKFKAEFRIHLKNNRYMLEVNGCQETGWMEGIPNIETKEVAK